MHQHNHWGCLEGCWYGKYGTHHTVVHVWGLLFVFCHVSHGYHLIGSAMTGCRGITVMLEGTCKWGKVEGDLGHVLGDCEVAACVPDIVNCISGHRGRWVATCIIFWGGY